MTHSVQADPVPLSQDADGALRVGDSRVLLEMVVRAFDRGASPEGIVESFPTLRINDVYSVISYYLNHRADVLQYLQARERTAATIRQSIESAQAPAEALRQRIQAWRTTQNANQ